MRQTPHKKMIFEHRFDAPPETIARVLTDFREHKAGDHQARLAGLPPDGARGATIEVGDRRVHIESDREEGHVETDVWMEGPLQWRAATEVSIEGRARLASEAVESLRAEGGGTLYHVEMTLTPRGLVDSFDLLHLRADALRALQEETILLEAHIDREKRRGDRWGSGVPDDITC